MTSEVPLVEAVDLERAYPGPPRVEALRPATFTIHAGDYVAVTGPSGSGKTTLLSVLGLLDEPTGGTYVLNGQDTALLGAAERNWLRAAEIGFVFQAFHLMQDRTVRENVELGLIYSGESPSDRRSKVSRVLSRVGLDHRIDFRCRTLSGGEKQRVAIARALVRRPSLVLCDEPTGNLDSTTSEQVLRLIEEVHSDGFTIVTITHDPQIAERAARRFVIDDGTVDADPTPTPPSPAVGVEETVGAQHR